MTPEEQAFCEEIRSEALKLIGITGLMERDALADGNAKQAWRANKLSIALLAIVQKSAQRMNRAEIEADQQAVADAGYDLAALATAAPSSIEE